jgi:hypothetical protein
VRVAPGSVAGRIWAGAMGDGHTLTPREEGPLGGALFEVDAGVRGLSLNQFAE